MVSSWQEMQTKIYLTFSRIILDLQGIFGFVFSRIFLASLATFSFAAETKNISFPGFRRAALPIVIPNECFIPDDKRSAPAPAAVLFSLKIWCGKTFIVKE